MESNLLVNMADVGNPSLEKVEGTPLVKQVDEALNLPQSRLCTETGFMAQLLVNERPFLKLLDVVWR